MHDTKTFPNMAIRAGFLFLLLAPLSAAAVETPASRAPTATEVSGVEPLSLRAGRNDPALDPFLAGALGIIPFASGLYLSDNPARGVAFTAVDVLLALGIYSSRYTVNGDPNNALNYFLLMGASNMLDAWISVRYARAGLSKAPRALMLPLPGGGVHASLRLSF